jgi:hypothetical protein
MNSLTTLSDGETYADVRFGDDFIVTIDRTARKDAITIRVFHPDTPETPVGEHRLNLTLDDDSSLGTPSESTQNNIDSTGALG